MKIDSLIAHIKDYKSYFPSEFLEITVGEKLYDKKYIPIKKLLERYVYLEWKSNNEIK